MWGAAPPPLTLPISVPFPPPGAMTSRQAVASGQLTTKRFCVLISGRCGALTFTN